MTCSIVAAVTGWVGGAAWQAAASLVAERGVVERIEEASAGVAYSATAEKWVEFPVTSLSPKLRLLTHADVSADLKTSGEDPLSYGLLLEWLDDTGRVLEERRVRHTLKLVEYRDPETGRAVTRNFYLDPGRVATEIKTTVMSTPEGASRLRARVEQADSRFQHVWLRLYETEPVAETRLASTWQRLARTEREQLARGNIYPPEFLTEEEKKALLRSRWRPVGPAGVEGRDYRAETLYSRPLERLTAQVVERNPIAGQFVDHHLHGSVSVPAGGGRVRLEFLSPDTDARLALDEVLVTWLGPGFGQRWQRRLSPDADGVIRVDVKGGLLDIAAGRRAILRAKLEREGGVLDEITSAPQRVRTFMLAPGAKLDFPIVHADRSATLVRVDLACPCFHDQLRPVEAVRTQYQLLDRSGGVVRNGLLVHAVKPANHELIDATPAGRLSARSHHYFRLPADVAVLRLKADRPILVAAFNRPETMPLKVSLSEDTGLAARDGVRRTWFYLQPIGVEQSALEEKTTLMEIRLRPSEDLPQLLAGQYRVDEFAPSDNWRGRYILESRGDGTAPRDSALGGVFTPLPTGEQTQADFVAAAPVQSVAPSLLYFINGTALSRLQVVVDSRTLFDSLVRPGEGELSLGPLSAGPHRLRVRGPALRDAYINYVRPHGLHYVRRLAMAVDGQSLRVPVRKESDGRETIVGSYYGAVPGTSCSISVRQSGVSLSSPGPFESVTLGPLAAHMTIPTIDGVSAEDRPPLSATPGHRFFFTLGDDVAPGPLWIEMEFTPSCGGGALVLTRLLPGRESAPAVLRDLSVPEE